MVGHVENNSTTSSPPFIGAFACAMSGRHSSRNVFAVAL